MINSNLSTLLTKGYFPAELPPCFTTISFSAAIDGAIKSNSLPPEFDTVDIYKSSKFNLARAGGLRRRLSLVNPVAHYRISKAIINSASEINSIYAKSTISKSKPQVATSPHALRGYEPESQLLELPKIRAATRSGRRYLVQTDITSFYSTIYTHSIPWALHTKAVAKLKKRDMNLAGNVIDTQIRNSQDQQTMGIPIGPDYSLIISEAILCSIDSQLESKFTNLKGFRYVDDYEFSFSSMDESEDFLGYLQDVLRGYELTLNYNKTKILEMPQSIEKPWASKIREFLIDQTKAKKQARDIINFFDLTFELMKENPDSSITPFALSKIRSSIIFNENEELFINLVLQAATAEVGAISRSALILHDRYIKNNSFKPRDLEDLINSHIIRHHKLGHDSEIVWALWLAMLFGLNINSVCSKILETPTDSATGILTLHLKHINKLDPSFDASQFQNLMTSKELNGEHWLIAYEADIQGWLPSSDTSNHVDADPKFKYLKSVGVKFFDPTPRTSKIQTISAQRYV